MVCIGFAKRTRSKKCSCRPWDLVTDADVVLARASRGYWLRPHDCMFLLCTEEFISARCVSVVD